LLQIKETYIEEEKTGI